MTRDVVGQDRSVERSWALRAEACDLIPRGTSTNSKAPTPGLEHVEPCFIARGKGCRVWDVDGNEYIDYRNALGPVTLGYAYPAVVEAVREQLDQGSVYGYPHPLEVEVARMLTEVIPCCDMVRFLKTGGEAMAAGIKVARAHTGRDVVVRCGYHGWLQNTGEAGVPACFDDCLPSFAWGDVGGLESLLDQHEGRVAAVSVAGSYPHLTPEDAFLGECRRLADAHDVLLIFDEIVTGFRIRMGGVQEYYGVTPDLAVFSKGMANGMPISVLAGAEGVMRTLERTTVSSTFAGDALALAGAKATIATYRERDVVGHLWRMGRRLVDGVNAIFRGADIPGRFQGCPTCPQLMFETGEAERDQRMRVALLGGLFRRGVSIYNVSYVNFSHQLEDIDETLNRWDDAVKAGLER
ncbi:MAG: aminotransferase class III-fold pyridoxal phosphate-dependent enzyme [Phycisphaerae bacterium]|nr:aminotransferase class III-fold pyridoxal phosphate-dependent enzyme [Phycisphaerae bacterium]